VRLTVDPMLMAIRHLRNIQCFVEERQYSYSPPWGLILARQLIGNAIDFLEASAGVEAWLAVPLLLPPTTPNWPAGNPITTLLEMAASAEEGAER
jgi:hypothetical protein